MNTYAEREASSERRPRAVGQIPVFLKWSLCGLSPILFRYLPSEAADRRVDSGDRRVSGARCPSRIGVAQGGIAAEAGRRRLSTRTA